MAGYCTDVYVTIKKDNIVEVTDNGQRIPIDIQKKKFQLWGCLTTLHAGGKFEGYKVSRTAWGWCVCC